MQQKLWNVSCRSNKCKVLNVDERSNCASQIVPVYNNPSCIHGMYTIHWCLQTGERHSIENGRIFCYCNLNNFQSSTGHLILENRSKIGNLALDSNTTIKAIGGVLKKNRPLFAFLASAAALDPLAQHNWIKFIPWAVLLIHKLTMCWEFCRADMDLFHWAPKDPIRDAGIRLQWIIAISAVD